MQSQRGLSANQEQKNELLIRDTRPLGQRILEDILYKPLWVSVFSVILAGAVFLMPVGSFFWFILQVILLTIILSQDVALPFRLPAVSNRVDPNDIHPGTKKPVKARGIYFFGNERENQKELWFANEDMRTHALIFGSTGSGKTEALISIAYNALLQASGFIYIDGKGDNSLFAKLFSMARYMGREDDLLLINFMTGARDITGPQETRISNTMNPFSAGSSSMLSNLVTSMMDSSSSGSGDGDMWKGRAIAFVEALFRVLVAMRDAGHVLLDAHVIRGYFTLERIEAMVCDKVFLRDNQHGISLEHYPESILQPMVAYLNTLPGFTPERKGKQVSTVFEQHGYIVMQLTRIFSSLADTYGHIVRTKLAEVDLRDVVLNRRILIVLLPALEKSPDELSNLGKIVIGALKVMMAAGLGDAVEGRYRDLIQRKPTNSETPFLCVLDEYGYYAVKGFAVVPAQARSLGFSVIFAGQDLPAFQKVSKEEAASIGANTNIKICMKLEDPAETWEFFQKTAGESYVTQVESFQTDSSSLTNTYMDTKSAKLEKRGRVDLLDLKEQSEGQAHLFFKSRIVRYNTFYANPKTTQAFRLNHLVKVDIMPDSDLYVLVKGIEDFEVLLRGNVWQNVKPDSCQYVDPLIHAFGALTLGSSLEKGSAALTAVHSVSDDKSSEHTASYQVGDASGDEGGFVSLFCVSGEGGASSEVQPGLLDAQTLHQQMVFLHQLLGNTQEVAEERVQSIIKDIIDSSVYRSGIMGAGIDEKGYLQALDAFVGSIGGDTVS